MRALALVFTLPLVACAARRTWGPPPTVATSPPMQAALDRFAPIVVQETAMEDPAARWDRPSAVDPDGSGTLADDYRHHSRTDPVPFYTSASEDGERLYLFYGLYYTADWSGRSASPEVDHRGDFEGALVVVSRARQTVEAVITQAHKRFYLWRPGAGLLVMAGRPVLFSESGGHGLYSFLDRAWHAKGGRRYARGMQELPPASLRRFAVPSGLGDVAVVVRPLSEIEPFVDSGRRGFKGLERGATPPWFWRGGGAGEGAIVRDAPALYAAMRRRPS